MHLSLFDLPSLLDRRALPKPSELPDDTVILDDTSATLIAYQAPFDIIRNSTCRGGTCTRLGDEGASMSFNFTGTSVWLFGKPGGIARIFVDGQLNQIFDSSGLPNDGSALWAKSGLASGKHSISLEGVAGQDLNLVVDFFSVDGDVLPIGSDGSDNTGNNAGPGTPSAKRMGVILGSVFATLLVLTFLIVGFFLYRKRRNQNQNRNLWNKEISRPVMYDGAGKDGQGSPTPFLNFNTRKSSDKEATSPPSSSSNFSSDQPQPQPQYPHRYQPQPITDYQNLDRVQFNNSLNQHGVDNYPTAYPPMPARNPPVSHFSQPSEPSLSPPPPPRPQVVIPSASATATGTSTMAAIAAKIPTPTRLRKSTKFKRMRSDVPRSAVDEDSPLDLERTPLMENVPFQIPMENNEVMMANFGSAFHLADSNGNVNNGHNGGNNGNVTGYGNGYGSEPDRQTMSAFSSIPTATTVPSAPTTGTGSHARTFGGSSVAGSESASAYSQSQGGRSYAGVGAGNNRPPQFNIQPPSTAATTTTNFTTTTDSSNPPLPPKFDRNLNAELTRYASPSPNIQQQPPPPYAPYQTQGLQGLQPQGQGIQRSRSPGGQGGRPLPEVKNVGAEKMPKWVKESL